LDPEKKRLSLNTVDLDLPQDFPSYVNTVQLVNIRSALVL